MKCKLTIDLLPKGAWNNNLSHTLPQKDWDVLREACYTRAGYKCAVCGGSDCDLHAHEIWDFNTSECTQTLLDIQALCPACHGVKHLRHSERIGYGDNAKRHFMRINECEELDFAGACLEADLLFDERNCVLRWKTIADLKQFGGDGIELPERNIPLIENPYEGIDWQTIEREEYCTCFLIEKTNHCCAPKIYSIEVDNYQGEITVICNNANKIEWFLDGECIKTKYNIVGKFTTKFNVKDLECKNLHFNLVGKGGFACSKTFGLQNHKEVL
jgi:hypothetical protein